MPANDLTGNVIEPELGRHILAELADLNADFISLIKSTESCIHRPSLPDEQIEQLRALSKPAVRRLTNCAFALFDLRLQDADLWRALGDGKPPKGFSVNDALGGNELHGPVRLFTLSALMYLRHLSDINRFFAKLSFGVSPEVLEIVSKLAINQLREIANRYPTLLCGRFGQHPQAWTDLLKLAKRNDTEPMLPAKILGYKHLYQQ